MKKQKEKEKKRNIFHEIDLLNFLRFSNEPFELLQKNFNKNFDKTC